MKRIVALAMAAFLGMTTIGCSSTPKSDEAVATVNGKEITVKEYQINLDLGKQTVENTSGTSIWNKEMEDGVKYKDKFKDSILNQMIDVYVIYDQAKKQNLLPSKEEVNKNFNEFKKAIDSDKEYKNTLKKLGIDDEFLKQQEELALSLQNFKNNFDKTTVISDEEIQKYYDEHKDEFYKDEVKASHILISTLDKDGKPLSEAKKKEAKKKAEEVLKKAQSGEDFATLAKEYSDDPGSASNGGDLGYFGKGQMVKPFEEAAFALKPGEISGIVESDYGYHIIKVFDKIDEQQPLSEVKDTIKTTLLNEKYAQTVENLKKSAKIEKNEEVIKKIKF